MSIIDIISYPFYQLIRLFRYFLFKNKETNSNGSVYRPVVQDAYRPVVQKTIPNIGQSVAFADIAIKSAIVEIPIGATFLDSRIVGNKSIVVTVDTQNQCDDRLVSKVVDFFESVLKRKSDNSIRFCSQIFGFDTRCESKRNSYAQADNEIARNFISDALGQAKQTQATKIAMFLQVSANVGGAGHIYPIFMTQRVDNFWQITVYDSAKGMSENSKEGGGDRHEFIKDQLIAAVKATGCGADCTVKQIAYEQQTDNGCMICSLLQLQDCVFDKESVQRMFPVSFKQQGFNAESQICAHAWYACIAYSLLSSNFTKGNFNQACKALITSGDDFKLEVLQPDYFHSFQNQNFS
jgi:hypothetical protein